MNRLEEQALEYAKQGFSVFPCIYAGKSPLTPHGCKDASRSKAQIHKWWMEHPNANIAIATGEPSDGLVVIDLDIKGDKRSVNYLKEWQEINGDLPDTWITHTGGGGHHILYKTDKKLRNGTNAELCIDVRANGGYIIAPPSTHPSGSKYRWLEKEGDVAWADDKVIEFLKSVDKKSRPNPQNFVLNNQINSGERNDVLFRYASSLQAKGYKDESIYERVEKANQDRCTTPLPQSELETIINHVLEDYEKGASNEVMQKSKNGVFTDCLTNLKAILENDDEFAGHFYYDERAFRNKVILPLPWDKKQGERLLSDIEYSQFQLYLENYETADQTMHIKATDKNVKNAFEIVCYDHRRNPLQEWLNSLEWDGVERMDKLATVFLGCEYSEYTQNVMRLIMLGAVKRAFQPGAKFDYVPVLVGSQGVGKSTFVQRMCPNPEWYLDNLTTMEGDEAVEKLENKWIVEIAELANLRRDKIETVKAFITQTQDTYRGKYKRNAEDRPRGAVFIGTTNSTSFLTDPSGNRRWLPLECGKLKPSQSLFEGAETEEFFEKAWAEAVHIYKAQEISLVLDPKNEAEAERVRDTFTVDDPQVGLIQKILDEAKAKYDAIKTETLNPPEFRVCMREIKDELEAMGEKNIYYSDIKETVMRLGEWDYHTKRRKCGDYGQQKYFTPKPPPVIQDGNDDIYF